MFDLKCLIFDVPGNIGHRFAARGKPIKNQTSHIANQKSHIKNQTSSLLIPILYHFTFLFCLFCFIRTFAEDLLQVFFEDHLFLEE